MQKKIILIAGTKGGPGKSTVASNLAAACQQEEKGKLLLVDSDPQASISKWVTVRNDQERLSSILSVQKTGEDIKNSIPALSDEYNNIIIDSGGYNETNTSLKWAMLVATHIVIPVVPSQFDIWELSKIVSMISQVKIVNSNIKGYFLASRLSTLPNLVTQEWDDLRQSIKDIDTKDVELMDSFISERRCYKTVIKDGASVLEIDDKSDSINKAKNEIINLYKEIYND